MLTYEAQDLAERLERAAAVVYVPIEESTRTLTLEDAVGVWRTLLAARGALRALEEERDAYRNAFVRQTGDRFHAMRTYVNLIEGHVQLHEGGIEVSGYPERVFRAVGQLRAEMDELSALRVTPSTETEP